MTAVPSRRLVAAAGALAAGSLAVLVLPGAWPVLLCANLALALAAAADLVVTPRPSALGASREVPGRVAAREEHRVALRVRNASRVRLRVRVRDGAPEGLSGGDAEHGGPVAARGEAVWEYAAVPAARGRFEWGPISLRYHSVLGLWERGREVPAGGELRVYPSLAALERYHLLARSDRLAAMGVRRVRARGGSTDFESLREYAPGDDVRQLDWMATARRGLLIVRNREAERNQTVLLLVDCGRLMTAVEGGASKLDHAVDAALLLAHVALARGDRVGLCTFSGRVHSWLVPRGTAAQGKLIADALFDLRADLTESDHGRCLRFLASRYPKRSLLVVLTDFVDATTGAAMVAHVGLAARRHVVLFAALKDAFLEAAARAVPATELAAFRKAAAVDLLRDRREVLERIRRAGGVVVDAEPGAITPPVINGYLGVMFGGLL
ncbi:DUF58 domain-containing protein [Gemmata sp.]|uniref:DUF58 domain-containing protein n=1 Tax=Gemmata sp. TaxID=1914242 RepID=UPI003F727040